MAEVPAEIGAEKFCPACDRSYADWSALVEHLKKAVAEGDQVHIDIVELEEWEEVLKATVVQGVVQVEPGDLL